MKAVAPITYRFIVAHWAPGVLSLYPLCVWIPSLDRLVQSAISEEFAWGHAVTLFVVTLISGLLIDGICFVSVSFAVRAIRRRLFKQETAKRDPQSKEDVEFMERIMEGNFAWQQFYAGTALIGVISAVSKVLTDGLAGMTVAIPLVVISTLFLIASARSEANNEALIASKWGTIEN